MTQSEIKETAIIISNNTRNSEARCDDYDTVSEIEYLVAKSNKDSSIAFAEWLNINCDISSQDNIWSYNGSYYLTPNLYEIFIEQKKSCSDYNC